MQILQELSSLAGRLMKGLTPRAASDPATLSRLQALASVGRVLPGANLMQAAARVCDCYASSLPGPCCWPCCFRYSLSAPQTRAHNPNLSFAAQT